MKKTVITYGLISGIVLSVLMASTVPFADRIGFENAMWVGYTTMVLAFLLIYFGMNSYKMNIGNGEIKFGKALGIGLLIMLISAACYSITWIIIHHTIMPDFYDKYFAYEVQKMKEAHASQAAIDKAMADANSIKEKTSNPLIEFLMVLLEPVPPGIIISLISAFIVSRKKSEKPALSN